MSLYSDASKEPFDDKTDEKSGSHKMLKTLAPKSSNSPQVHSKALAGLI